MADDWLRLAADMIEAEADAESDPDQNIVPLSDGDKAVWQSARTLGDLAGLTVRSLEASSSRPRITWVPLIRRPCR